MQDILCGSWLMAALAQVSNHVLHVSRSTASGKAGGFGARCQR